MFCGIKFRHNLSFAAIVSVAWILGDQNQSLAQKVSTAPVATLFSEIECKGQGIVTTTSLPTLSTQKFINQAKSVMATGVWVFYEYESYNDGKGAGVVEYIYPQIQGCVNLKSNLRKTSSLRVVGGLKNSSENVLNLFQGNYFQGKVQVIKTDVKGLKDISKPSSLIINGRIPWTVYSKDNYLGSAVCVKPPISSNLTPAFVYNVSKIWKEKNVFIKSVKMGCTTIRKYDVETDQSYTHLGYAVQGFKK